MSRRKARSNSSGGGLNSVVAGNRIDIDTTDPLNPVINWVDTTYSLRNTTSNIPALEEYTVCTAAAGVEYTLPQATTAGERHTIINRDTNGLKVSGTGGDGFGNKDIVSQVFVGPGEGMTFIADGVNTWLYEQDRTMYDLTSPVIATAGVNVSSVVIESMFFTRTGNTIAFFGTMTLACTAPFTPSSFTISMPPFDSNQFSQASNLGGTCTGKDLTGQAQTFTLVAQPGTNDALAQFYINLATNDSYVIQGSYNLQ